MKNKLYVVVLDWDDIEKRYRRYVIAGSPFSAVAYFVYHELTEVGECVGIDCFDNIDVVPVEVGSKYLRKLVDLTRPGILNVTGENNVVSWLDRVMFSIGGVNLEAPAKSVDMEA